MLKRPQTGDEKHLANQIQKLLAVVHNPQTWELASVLTSCREPGTRGVFAEHPRWLLLLLISATQITGSQRAAVGLMDTPYLWTVIRAEIEKARPAHLAAPGSTPPTRSQFRTMLDYMETEQGQAEFEQMRLLLRRSSSIAHARAAGLLDPEQPLRYKDIDFGQWLTYDGTVYKPAARFGRRIDGTAGDQLRSGTETVFGPKVVYASVRGTDFHDRWILDFEQVIGKTEHGVGDEGKAIERSALRMKQEAPGMRGIIVDSVIHGWQLSLLALHGILTVNVPIAAQNPDRATKGRMNDRRVEKKAKLPTHVHTLESRGECNHTLRVIGGMYQEQVLDEEGKAIWVDREVRGYKGGRPDANGQYRWYHEIAVPCQYGDQVVLIPLFHEPRAKVRGQAINRGEHFRFYPQDTVQHQVLYGRRNDTESLHRELKNDMERVPAYSKTRQALFLLGVQLAHNSMTYAYAQRRAGKRNVIDGNT